MLPLSGLDDELAALREEVARLQTENARLLRLLELRHAIIENIHADLKASALAHLPSGC